MYGHGLPGIVVIVLALTTVSGPAWAAEARELVLGSAGSDSRLEAVAGPCKAGQRTLRVQQGDAQRTATLSRPWNTLPCDLAKAKEPGWNWTGGDEEASASVKLQTVDLAGGPTALLLTIEAGFEHVKRQHALFIPAPEGVTRAWEGDEGAGPTHSFVEPHEGGVLFTETFDGAQVETADRWSLSELRWDAARKKVVARPARAWGVILRTEESLPSALASVEKLKEECKDTELLAVATEDFPRLTKDRWVVARFFPSLPRAEAARKRLLACARDAYVKRVL